MFGIGSTEFLVIIVVAVLVLGPEHLPRIMRTLGKVMGDVRRVSTEFQRTMNLELHQEEARKAAAAKPKKKKAAPKPEAETAAVESAPEPVAEIIPPAAAETAKISPAEQGDKA